MALFKTLCIHFASKIVSQKEIMSGFTHTVIDSSALGGSVSALAKNENIFGRPGSVY